MSERSAATDRRGTFWAVMGGFDSLIQTPGRANVAGVILASVKEKLQVGPDGTWGNIKLPADHIVRTCVRTMW